MINGAPTDNNAKLFKQGAHSVLDTSRLKIGEEYDTPDWSPDKAQSEMDQAITEARQGRLRRRLRRQRRHRRRRDRRHEGAPASTRRPVPTTGQDAELAAIQRILAGEQYMTVYKADQAGGRARPPSSPWRCAKGRAAVERSRRRTVNNGTEDVPSVILDPVAVTKDNIKDTVVKDGFWTRRARSAPAPTRPPARPQGIQ